MDFFKTDWLALASHSLAFQILLAGLILVTGLALVMLVRFRRAKGVPVWTDGLADRVSVKPRPLMNGSDASMFNLLLLAVRDHFLLLAKIPLKSLVRLRIEDEALRRFVARTLRNVTVDFVVVHPGTQLPVKAIFVGRPDGTASSLPERLTDALFQQAGIDVIRLDQDAGYSVERLTRLLGLEEET